LNVFDGVVGAGNYWEKIQDSMEMAESNHPEARTLVLRRRLPEKQRRRLIRASKQKTVWVSAQYKSSLNGDFNDICNKTCGPFDRFDYPLRFMYRAIPANA